MTAPTGKILIKVDIEQKNAYTMADGTEIVLRRDIENLDKRYTQQVMGEVIDSEYIPKGSLILFHHNATHDVNVVFDSDYLTKQEVIAGFKVISLNESQCYLWKYKGGIKWHPLKNFCTALRVFEPYKGALVGIQPKLIKNVLYLLTGEYKGKVAHTLKACDYQITFRNENGVDEHFIRCRHFEDEEHEREEIIAIADDLTKKVNSAELLIGINIFDAKIKQKWHSLANH